MPVKSSNSQVQRRAREARPSRWNCLLGRLWRATVPVLYLSSDPDTQPRHRNVRGQQIERDEPRRRWNHEARRNTTAEEYDANCETALRLVGRGNQVGRERAHETAQRMCQEGHQEVSRLEKMYPPAQAFSVAYIHASRWRNERRAESDECRVDGPAYDDSSKNGNDISKPVGHCQFASEA
jgi:hypothetical protein